MPRLSILPRIGSKLKDNSIFTDDEIARIVLAATSIRNKNDLIKGFIIDAFNLITSADTTFLKGLLLEMIERFAYEDTEDEPIQYFRVDQGESFCLDFNLNSGEDFTGLFLTARDASDRSLLSANNIAGTAASTQQIPIDDLSLTAQKMHRIDYSTESDSGGTASGDVQTTLAKVYFIVRNNADSS